MVEEIAPKSNAMSFDMRVPLPFGSDTIIDAIEKRSEPVDVEGVYEFKLPNIPFSIRSGVQVGFRAQTYNVHTIMGIRWQHDLRSFLNPPEQKQTFVKLFDGLQCDIKGPLPLGDYENSPFIETCTEDIVRIKGVHIAGGLQISFYTQDRSIFYNALVGIGYRSSF